MEGKEIKTIFVGKRRHRKVEGREEKDVKH